jgi:hypothetical protein
MTEDNNNPAPVELSRGIKPLKWSGNEVQSAVGCYRVQRLDDKWETLHNGYHMQPKLHGVVSAFDTVEAAKAAAHADYEKRVRSCLAASEGSTE